MPAPQADHPGDRITIEGPPLAYRPRRRRRLLFAVFFLGIGVLTLAMQGWLFRHSRSVVVGTDPALHPGNWFPVTLGLVMLALVLWGAPRLTIGRDGLTLRSTFRTRAVPSEALGPFTLVFANRGRRRERLLSAWAPVTPRASRWARRLVLPNAFTMPLPAILEVVARHHRGLPAGAAAVIDLPARPTASRASAPPG